jgi:type VI secretion system protein ImpH
VSTSHELAPRHAIDDEALRYYAGHLSQRHRSALGLEQMLSDYFGIEVVVEQLSGQWLPLDPADQTCLLPSGGNTQLGFGALIGERVWDVQSKFRIRLGPLGIRQFRQFLPSGDAHVPLVQLTRLYVGQQFDFDVQLILARREVPACELNGSGAQGVRLGWETWIRAGEVARDVRDAVFSVQDG